MMMLRLDIDEHKNIIRSRTQVFAPVTLPMMENITRRPWERIISNIRKFFGHRNKRDHQSSWSRVFETMTFDDLMKILRLCISPFVVIF